MEYHVPIFGNRKGVALSYVRPLGTDAQEGQFEVVATGSGTLRRMEQLRESDGRRGGFSLSHSRDVPGSLPNGAVP